MLVPEAFGALSSNGQNLFHSFASLNVGATESLHFQALAPSIQAIVARVTGLEGTRIDGALSADATLYLLNPQGMVVGPGASLDTASTLFLHQADTVRFAGGERFRVRDQSGAVNLAITAPLGVSFAPLALDAAFAPAPTLSFNGAGEATVGPRESQVVGANQFLSFSALSLYPGQGLTVRTAPSVRNVIARVRGLEDSQLSGPLRLIDGGTGLPSSASLFLFNGQGLALASGAAFSGADQIQLAVAEELRFSDGTRFGLTNALSEAMPDTFLLGRATDALSLSGVTLRVPEALALTAPQLSLSEARLEAPSLGLSSSGALSLVNSNLLAARPGIAMRPTEGAELAIVGGQLVTVQSSRLATRTAGGGLNRLQLRGAELFVNASSITASNQSADGAGALLNLTGDNTLRFTASVLEANTTGGADAGRITLAGPTLTLDGSEVRSESLAGASGNGGDILLSGSTLSLVGGTVITSEAQSGQGSGGAINVEASRALTLTPGARLASSAVGEGDGGSVRLDAPVLTVRGASLASTSQSLANSALLLSDASAALAERLSLSLSPTSLGDFLTGLGAYFSAQTGEALTATSPAALVASLVGALDGEALRSLEETLPFTLAELARLTVLPPKGGAVGSAGTVALSGQTLAILDSDFSVETGATGAAAEPGRITVDATQSLEVLGSELQSNSTGASAAGRLRLTAPDLLVTATSLRADATVGATGSAGDVLLEGDRLTLLEGTRLLSESNDGGGNAGLLRAAATERLTIVDGTLATTSRGSGDAGAITLLAPALTLRGTTLSSVSQAVFGPTTGGAGLVTLNGDALRIESSLLETVNSASARERPGTISLDATTVLEVLASELRADATAQGDAGNVLLRAPLLTLEGATVQAVSLASATGNAGRVGLLGDHISLTGFNRLSSKVFSDGGDGGGVRVEADSMIRQAGQGIFESSVTGEGSAGQVGFFAPDITLEGAVLASTSSADPLRQEGPVGAAGALRLEGERVTLSDVSLSTETQATASLAPAIIGLAASERLTIASTRLVSTTLGAAPAGALELSAPVLELTALEALAEARNNASGDAGNILISGDSLVLSGGNVLTSRAVSRSGRSNAGFITLDLSASLEASASILSTSVRGPGNAGAVTVSAPEVTFNRVRLASTSEQAAGLGAFAGSAGQLSVTADTLSLADSALATTTAGGEKASPAEITLSATGRLTLTDTELESSTSAAAAAGDLTLSGASIDLSDTLVRADSLEQAVGAAGSLTVLAVDAVTLTGESGTRLSTSSQGAGQAGDIVLRGNSLRLEGPSAIFSESFGTGASGTLDLVLGTRLDMLAGTRLSTDARLSQGGNISVETLGSEIFLTGASIQASAGAAGAGGDIALETTFLVLEEAAVLAEADAGNGGKIDIFAEAVVPDVFTQISADSNTGNAGVVNIQAPDIDLNAVITGQQAQPLVVPALDLGLCAPGSRSGLRLRLDPLRSPEPVPGAPLGSVTKALHALAGNCGGQR
jgi:filamentous hemagglutinin family protein